MWTLAFSLHENNNFCLEKFCEKNKKDHIFIRFCMFPFYGNIIFSELFFKRKCKKAASSRKCLFLHKYEISVCDNCAFNMKLSMLFCHENKRFFTCEYVNFLLTIFKRKAEICYVVLHLKQAIGQLLLKMFIYFFANIL